MPSDSPIRAVAIGDIIIDWVIEIESVHAPVQSLWKESSQAIKTAIGGSGVLFAIAASRAGFESHLIGKVGDDAFGTHACELLRSTNVVPHVLVDNVADTGKVVILRDSNDQKAMISHRGANVSLNPGELNPEIIKNCDLLYISGYALLQKPQSLCCLEAVKEAKVAGTFTVLDVVPHRVFSTALPPEYIECLSLVDCIVLELGTARAMLKTSNEDQDMILDQLLQCYKLVVLRPSNDVQVIADNSFRKVENTGYSSAVNKVGFLDKLTASTLYAYLAGKLH